MIYFGSPAFFVESSDGLMMDRRQADRASRSPARSRELVARRHRVAHRLVRSPEWSCRETLYTFAVLNYWSSS